MQIHESVCASLCSVFCILVWAHHGVGGGACTYVHMCVCVCMFLLFAAVLTPTPVSPAQSTHTGAAHTLPVCSPFSRTTSCEWYNVGQWTVGQCGCIVFVCLCLCVPASMRTLVHSFAYSEWYLALCSVLVFVYCVYGGGLDVIKTLCIEVCVCMYVCILYVLCVYMCGELK